MIILIQPIGRKIFWCKYWFKYFLLYWIYIWWTRKICNMLLKYSLNVIKIQKYIFLFDKYEIVKSNIIILKILLIKKEEKKKKKNKITFTFVFFLLYFFIFVIFSFNTLYIFIYIWQKIRNKRMVHINLYI